MKKILPYIIGIALGTALTLIVASNSADNELKQAKIQQKVLSERGFYIGCLRAFPMGTGSPVIPEAWVEACTIEAGNYRKHLDSLR